MVKKTSKRCREFSRITEALTDNAIELYKENKMVDFWDAIDALDLLTSVQEKLCYIEE